MDTNIQSVGNGASVIIADSMSILAESEPADEPFAAVRMPAVPSHQGIRQKSVDLPKSPILMFERLSEWMECFCVVTFDLEFGQSMEVVCPNHVHLSEQDKTNICYLAFPDSNSGCLGDTYFHFRTCLSVDALSFTKQKSALVYNGNCAPSLQTDKAMCYGYVFFRQVKDRNIRRGYFQKSVVLISRLPFLNIFREVLRIVAPEFFENGNKALDFACKEVDRWPELQIGTPLCLPIFGHRLCVTIPSVLDGALPGASYPSNLSALPASLNIPITSVHDVDFMKIFHGFLTHLHIFWELVLCNDPVAVIAPSPTACSEIVQGLVWIIWPLKYAADYRPFFTIHDQDFKEYTTRTQAAPRIILGVTNPFFVKTLQHWPHVLRAGDAAKVKPEESPKPKNLHKLTKTVDMKQGLYSEYKPFLSKDKVLIKRLHKGIQTNRAVEAQSSLIKKYYYELTQSFMIPLERYVSTLMPLVREISPFKSPPVLREFECEEFLETVEVAGPQLTSGTKGNWKGLYKKFLRSENFDSWFLMKKLEINRKLRLLHLEALANSDFIAWGAEKSEVEIVDIILKTRNRLKTVRNDGTVIPPETISKLRYSLEGVMEKLPSDLTVVLKNNNQLF